MSSNCPRCGTESAYIGFQTIECVNTKCDYYTVKHATTMLREALDEAKRNEPSEPKESEWTDERYWTELMFNSD